MCLPQARKTKYIVKKKSFDDHSFSRASSRSSNLITVYSVCVCAHSDSDEVRGGALYKPWPFILSLGWPLYCTIVIKSWKKKSFFFFWVCIICLNNGWRQRWMRPAPNFLSQSGLIFLFYWLIIPLSIWLVGITFYFFMAKFSDRAHCLFNFLYCLARKQNGEFLFFFFFEKQNEKKREEKFGTWK